MKKAQESDEAFARRVLGKLAAHKDIIVIKTRRTTPIANRPLKISKNGAEQGIDLDEATR